MKRITETHTPEETYELGYKEGLKARKGDIYALYGDLGTGKTVFVQGFAKGMGTEEMVNSPTFTIEQIYEEGRLPLYHFDVYRIGDVSELDEIGFEECLYGDGVTLVEWAGICEEYLPREAIRILIEKDMEKGADYRRITIDEDHSA